MKRKKKTVTKQEMLMARGLLAIARRHNAAIREVEATLGDLVGEEADPGGYLGHVSDAVWDDESNADDLIKKLELTVEP